MKSINSYVMEARESSMEDLKKQAKIAEDSLRNVWGIMVEKGLNKTTYGKEMLKILNGFVDLKEKMEL